LTLTRQNTNEKTHHLLYVYFIEPYWDIVHFEDIIIYIFIHYCFIGKLEKSVTY